MPEGTQGWVMDNDGEVYWIMAILWKSCGLFLRGTICYRVQDQHRMEFALKDCWVDTENLDHEDQYARQTDCTERIHEHITDNPLSPSLS
jgi:hypothetical protein